MSTELATIDAEYSVIPTSPTKVDGALETSSRLVQWMTKNANTPAYIANIQGKQYPKVEWWTAAGAALGLFPFEVSCTKIERDNGYVYEAVVEVRRGNTAMEILEQRLLGAKETRAAGDVEPDSVGRIR